MEEKTKKFICEDCGAREFEITVEPNYPLTEDTKAWLEEIELCPNCGGEIEEIL